MRLTFLILLSTLSLALAHLTPPADPPINPLSTSCPSSSVDPGFTLTVFDFYAYLTTSATTSNYNWATFTVYTNDYSSYAVCSIATTSSLPSNDNWHPCEMLLGGKGEEMLFQVTEGFEEVGIKMGWDVNGTYLTGWATEGTYWNEGDGGNVTTADERKYYQRSEPWKFEITRVIA